MSTTYQRLEGSDVWHFHPDCQHVTAYHRRPWTLRAKKPTTGELCNECSYKAHRDGRLGRRR